MTTPTRELWTCTECGRAFANRNQPHACGRHDLESHFAGKPPEIRALFDALLERVQACGPVRVLPEKTRIAFQVRMSFAVAMPKRGWVDGHLVLARRVESPRIPPRRLALAAQPHPRLSPALPRRPHA
jgi:hypothetical protein